MSKKILICLLLSTALLTACATQNENDKVNTGNKTDTENSQNTNGEDTGDNSGDISENLETDINGTTTNNQDNNDSENKQTGTSTEVGSNTSANLNDMDVKVKEYIINGQGDKPEALKLKWSRTFLEKVDFNQMYKDYLADGGTAGDVEWFASYITSYSPIQSNWEDMFKKDVLKDYNENIVNIKHLDGDLYQGSVMINGLETPYLVVSARTGYYHGTSGTSTAEVKAKVQLYEGAYFDSRRFGGNGPNTWCQVEISNITDTTFDFTVCQMEYTDLPNSDELKKNMIFNTNTAAFIEDGTKAVFYGNDYTLNFTFPDNHEAYPVVTDIQITGFKPLEGNTYANNGIPGHEFS